MKVVWFLIHNNQNFSMETNAHSILNEKSDDFIKRL